MLLVTYERVRLRKGTRNQLQFCLFLAFKNLLKKILFLIDLLNCFKCSNIWLYQVKIQFKVIAI